MMMARLLEALRPDTRLVLVGDPDQLSSVGAGAVLADLVGGYAGRADSPVLSLSRPTGSARRSARSPARCVTATPTRRSTPARRRRRLGSGSTERPARALRAPACCALPGEVRLAAEAGDDEAALAALDRHRLLCAHRDGPPGVASGTGWSSAARRGRDRRRATGRAGTPAARSWSPPTTTASASTTATPGSSCRPAASSGRRRRRWPAARLRHLPARRRRDHARDDHPQEPGQPGRRDHRAAARGRLAAAHPRALLHRGHPGPATGCASSAPRPRSAPLSAAGRARHRAPGAAAALPARRCSTAGYADPSTAAG